MSMPKKLLNVKTSEVFEIQQHQKQEVISTSILDLTNIVSDIALDIEKLDVYISAIQKLTNNKHTPFDEVIQIKDILENVIQQSENLKRRHSDLLVFLSNTKQELLLKS